MTGTKPTLLRTFYSAVILGAVFTYGNYESAFFRKDLLIAAVAGYFFSLVLCAVLHLLSRLVWRHKIAQIILTIIFVIPVVLYVIGISNASKSANPLSGAVFYDGAMPEPVPSDYGNEAGAGMAMIYPGQLNLFVAPVTPPESVEKLAAGYGANILAKIPKMGYYFYHAKLVFL